MIDLLSLAKKIHSAKYFEFVCYFLVLSILDLFVICLLLKYYRFVCYLFIV